MKREFYSYTSVFKFVNYRSQRNVENKKNYYFNRVETDYTWRTPTKSS